MSTPDTAQTAVDVESAARDLDRELRRLRIPRSGRAELLAEVRADLRAAADDGIRHDALLGDVGAFAREAVAARGWTPRPRDWWSATSTAVTVGAVALGLGYLLLVEVLNPLLSTWVDLGRHYPVAGPVLVYAGLALIGLAGALTGFGSFLAGRPAARNSVLRAALLLPLAAALGVGVAILFGRSQAYSTAPQVVLVEVMVVGIACAAALWLARWWGLRSGADTATPVELSEV
jgi:hypothetical protein